MERNHTWWQEFRASKFNALIGTFADQALVLKVILYKCGCIYSFAFTAWAFFRIGSILVAFITSPLTFSFPPMNSLCAFALPLTSLPKSSSESDRVTVFQKSQPLICAERQLLATFQECSSQQNGNAPVGFSPRPLPTSPLFFRSICQLSVSPALFFNVKANTAFPCLIASFRSASDAWRAALMASKASDEGKLSIGRINDLFGKTLGTFGTFLQRHGVVEFVKIDLQGSPSESDFGHCQCAARKIGGGDG
jgi:hypothetical protein